MRLNNSEIFIFFDDGDTLNDNSIRGRQWQQMLGEYFSPQFGGEPKIWGIANVEISKDFGGKGVPKLIYENRDKSHKTFIEWFIEKWINEMFDFVGVERPEKKRYKEIFYGATKFIAAKVSSSFPGVIESIKELYSRDYRLCTASGTDSIELNYYLESMGVRQYFTKIYGPDLINILKVDDAFYRAIFKDLDISPNQAIIIEDKPYYLHIAKKLGAIVIQACMTGKYEKEFPYIVTDMKNLPQIIMEVIENNFIC